MRIDGKALADGILDTLKRQVTALREDGTTPTMAVILAGDDPASLAYIRQKQKKAEAIGAAVIFDHQSADITREALASLVKRYNRDPSIHGLIIQRPVPMGVGDVTDIIASVDPKKDVDGFVPGSPFDVPVAAGVGETLREYLRLAAISDSLESWIRDKHVVVIGRGSTAGKPIMEYFRSGRFAMMSQASQQRTQIVGRDTRPDNLGCTTSQIHSGTPDPASITKQADIVVSCVGRERVVTGDMIKPGAILIGVGLWRDTDGKLRGDYDEAEIEDVAAAYTPTPGGIGPVNVACLMQNLVKACILQKEGAARP